MNDANGPPARKRKAASRPARDRESAEEWNWRPSTFPIEAILGKPIHIFSPEVLDQIEKEFGLGGEQLDTELKEVAVKYYHYKNLHDVPRPRFINRQAGRVKTASEGLQRVLADLPPFFERLLDEELGERTKVRLKGAVRGGRRPSLDEILTVLIDYCESFEQLLRPGAPPKGYLVKTAKSLVDAWEELSGDFKGSYNCAPHKGVQRFSASAPLFAQFVLQDLDPTLTTKQIERAIREARTEEKDAGIPYTQDDLF
ncbi:hypothetical protein [Microvirga aerophila]|nr:hypothetical protein [Microvirga aerophila]